MNGKESGDDLLEQLSRELMGRLTQDFEKAFASMLAGMSPEAVFGPYLGRILQGMGGHRSHEQAAYRMLGLQPSATDREVKRRYRELVKRLHPDVAGPETEHLFKQVQAAYEEIGRCRGWKA